ncbi:MAG: DNA-deoxyinosine glycosylase [Gammaproteobacteria bacterium]|nr:DNA-deoxyinosine glycosylase [Gammaproteobacteria bacterium]MBU2059264.1 DNA-deoxyinosine glycosylase [Gammaproteobacteria bacterium]MBU2176802.1 DNA-deoxyinosine glycosylase [Gammaproteobacteria bacterium]MBU2246621.1 DNA-deoxyinosine glycosylase [Gammaproteobacteria bacterium]MBU2344389.1 DNA-deoxyinosine glycosylase [Gammaproteobacteria bacterium]
MSSELLTGLAPILGVRPRILLLGSMPGAASLTEQRYYAHPRNLFWSFMQQLFAIPTELDYQQRCQLLTEQGIALWDVVAHCERAGSLDSAIKKSSVICNAIPHLLDAEPQILKICFNGAKAAEEFKRHLLPLLKHRTELEYIQLPSSSPAHASQSKEQKLAVWAKALLE